MRTQPRRLFCFALFVALILGGISACGDTDETINQDEVEAPDNDNQHEDNQLEDNQLEDNQHEDNQLEDNQLEDNQLEDNQAEDNQLEDNQLEDNQHEEDPDPQPIGAFCDDDLPCEEGLLCFRDLNPDAMGFCTQRCETPNTGCGYVGPDLYLKCTLSDDEGPICGFICYLDHGDHGHSYSCPSGDWGRLRCQMTTGPENHRYCAPRE